AEQIPNLDPAGVPEIDFVGALSEVKDHFGLVLSCHSVEHHPDLVRHLKDVENVLDSDGVYALVIPDKRYCFDHFLPESNLAEVIAAHHELRTKHTLQKVIEHRSLTTHNFVDRHWRGDHGSQTITAERIEGAVGE